MKNYKRHINSVEVVSFDIFDTLLRRPYANPKDLFDIIEKNFNRPGFQVARTSAEQKFYAGNPLREANLDDIYNNMPGFGDLKQIELELELSGLESNPEVKEIYDYALQNGKKIVIASDMYLPFEFIERVLAKNGFDGYYKLYLSNAINKRKDRGDMYPYIAKDLGTPSNKILHIGDNKHSDYIMARKNGLRAYLYRPIPVKWKNVAGAITAQYQPTGDYFIDFGYRIAGPIAYAYTRFIYNNAIKNNLDTVLFVARDGYLIKNIFEMINDANIKSEYVYAPRILNYTANLDYEPLIKDQAKIIGKYFDIPNCTHEYIQDNIEKFKKFAVAEKEKTGYVKYIKNIVGDSKCVGVVDTISGQLSAQKLIERESGTSTYGFYWLVVLKHLRSLQKIQESMSHSCFCEQLNMDMIGYHSTRLIELVFSAPENPIITMMDGKPVRKMDCPAVEINRQKTTEKIHIGAIKFVQDMARRLNNNNPFLLNQFAFDLIVDYVKNPNKTDRRAMRNVCDSDLADNSQYVPLFGGFIQWEKPFKRFMLSLIKIEMRGLKKLLIIFFPKSRFTILKIILFKKFGIVIGRI